MAEQRTVVCRTHFVDERLVAFARSVHGIDGYQVVFAVDETLGSINTFEFEKISLTRASLELLRLYNEIDDVFWRCGDYSLYLARLHYPDCDTFWLIEYDVTINRAEPVEFFKEFDEVHEHDFLTSHFRKPEDWWMWRVAMEARSDDVYRSYFPLVRLSGRGLDLAMAERVKATHDIRQLPRGQHPEWPNDEAFIATVLQNAGYQCADFNDLGRFYTNQTFWMTVLVHPTSLPPHDGMIYHAVRTGKQYLKIVLTNYIKPLPEPLELLRLAGVEWTTDEMEDPLRDTILAKLEGIGDNPRRVMEDGGIVAQVLAQNITAPVLRAVAKALVARRMLECLHVFRTLQVAQWWPRLPMLDNVALAKPAWQSSVSYWSRPNDTRLDAEGANNARLDVEYGFHTESEPQPWWTVDLMETYLITRICIHNRLTHSERLSGFRILASTDGHAWQIAYRDDGKTREEYVSGRPIYAHMTVRTRFLRVQIPHYDYLHFREFEAYGTICS